MKTERLFQVLGEETLIGVLDLCQNVEMKVKKDQDFQIWKFATHLNLKVLALCKKINKNSFWWFHQSSNFNYNKPFTPLQYPAPSLNHEIPVTVKRKVVCVIKLDQFQTKIQTIGVLNRSNQPQSQLRMSLAQLSANLFDF